MAKKIDNAKREALKHSIRLHLQLVGPRDWDKLQVEHPDVARSTIFRVIDEVRREILTEAASDSPVALKEAQRRIKSLPENLQVIQQDTGRHIPCAPSPSIIADQRDRGVATLRILATIDQVLEDGNMLRAHAMSKAEDGTEKIKNAHLLVQSAKLRLDTTASYLNALAQAHSLERIQDLYRIVLEEVGKAAPEVQHAILLRLKAANDVHGMTVEAEF